MGKKKASTAVEVADPKPLPTSTPAPSQLSKEANYTVVARRYRPQQFSELIGQEHVAQALINALQSGRVAHAYLFTGARGVGKTSSARILAKALNCVKGPTPKPCDQCDICQSIASGEDVDVLEIDGASNNKVEEIRDLRSNVHFLPSRARYKIYIIDEVHMLSTGAFNALLKTLEEPPPHVKFIFATTELQKIPVTILSRCQRFDFVNVGVQKIYAQLKHIVSKEGLSAEDEALHLIARRANGSMRDSQSLLDQLLAFAQGDLTADKVYSLLGIAGDDRIFSLADAILKGASGICLEIISEQATKGLQLGELLDQLIEYWRGMMLLLSAGSEFQELSGSPAYLEHVRADAQKTSLDTVLAGLDVMTTSRMRLRSTTLTQLVLEMTVVRLARMGELLSVTELSQWVRAGGVPECHPAPQSGIPAQDAAEPSVKKKQSNESSTPLKSADKLVETSDEITTSDLWTKLKGAVGPIRAFDLSEAQEHAISAPNNLVIRFPAGYSRAYDSCASETGKESLLATLKRITGKEWVLRIEQAESAGSGATMTALAPALLTRNELLQLPMFQKIVEVLGGQSLQIDSAFDPKLPALTAMDEKNLDLTDETPPNADSEEG